MITNILLRPNFSTAIAWSSLAHVSVIIASVAWFPSPADRVTLSGQTSVIQVQFVELSNEPTERSEETLTNEAQIERSDASRQPVNTLIAFAQKSVRETPKLDALQTRKKTYEIIKPETPLTAHVPRQKSDSQAVVSLAAIPTVAGTDDKSPPDLAGNPPPPYPSEAIRRRLEGSVMLRLHINSSGRVSSVEIAESSGHAILDNSAVNTVRSWRGQPARLNGQPVATIELLPVRFRL